LIGEATLFEYKVITERDNAFSGAFDVEAMEAALNAHAADGWRPSTAPVLGPETE